MSPIEPSVSTPADTVEFTVTTPRAVSSVTVLRPKVTETDSGIIVDMVSVTLETSTPLEPGIDTLAPEPPTELAAVATTGGVLVTWVDPPDSDLAGVRIYRSTTSGSGFTLVHTAAKGAQAWLDTDATSSVTYYYRADAIDARPNVSALTAEVSVLGGETDQALYLLASATEYLAWNEDGDPLIWRD